MLGLILVAVSLVNLGANLVWLRSAGPTRSPESAALSARPPGFWITSAVFAALLITGLMLLASGWRRR